MSTASDGDEDVASVSRDKTNRAAAAVLVFFPLFAAILILNGWRSYPLLHAILDTAIQLLSCVTAWLLWEVGVRTERPLPKLIAISFAAASFSELLHALVNVEWFGVLTWVSRAALHLRGTTWPVAAYVMPAGVVIAILSLQRGKDSTARFALGLSVMSILAFLVFENLPRYTEPTWFGFTRPVLALAPTLFVAMAIGCWHYRAADRILSILAPMGGLLAIAHVVMLYSRQPHDTVAVIAHMGKMAAYLYVLLSMMSVASTDMLQRMRAEKQLAQINEALEVRVQQRTADLLAANAALKSEMNVRRAAEAQATGRLRRLNLLHQITRSIAQRHDLRSIFLVVLHSLEFDFPVDFACVALHEAPGRTLEISAIGNKSRAVAQRLSLAERMRIDAGDSYLSRVFDAGLIYERDARGAPFPLYEQLARAGLHSVVLVPLMVQDVIHGMIIAARQSTDAFASADCEFLSQLTEHTALAAQQAHLYSILQSAYDDLRQTQQTVMQQERLRALGQMSSGIAHDINNAIMPISLYSDLLLKDPGIPPRSRKYIETIQHAVSDVSQTVDRLREFARNRDPEIRLSAVSLNGLVLQAIDLTRARWNNMPQQSGVVINIAKEFAPLLPEINAIESEIREALTNLIFNAVDAMPSGGTLTLRTGTATRTAPGLTARPTVYVEVADTGIGMDEITRQRCLEPFFTTKGERGTGLGLAMVFGIMQRHSAEMEIHSIEGKGTTIRLVFDVPELIAQSAIVAPTVQGRSLRVLLIDDDPLVIAALRDFLEADGHTVTTAAGGQDGIDKFGIQQQQADTQAQLVITDLGMPYLDGRAVAKAIKAMSPTTPVVLLTGWDSNSFPIQTPPRMSIVYWPNHPRLLNCEPFSPNSYETTPEGVPV